MLEWLFYALFFVVPLVFYTKTSEAFELNKIVCVYIFTTLIIATWLIKMIRQKRIIFKRTILDIPLLIFLGSQLISTIFSIDVRTSIFGYYSRFNGGLLSLICYALLYWAFTSNFNKQNSSKLIKITLISATIVAVWGIFEHFGHSFSCIFVSGQFSDSCWVQDVQTRVFATLGQPNWLAAYLTLLIPLTWYFALKNKQKQRLIWIAVSIIFFACILFTKSKSALGALAISYLIFWVFNIRRHFKLFIAVNLLFLIIVGIFGSPWSSSIFTISNNQGLMNQTPTDTGEGGTDSWEIRKIVWSGAIQVFEHYPLIGTGVETFGYSYWEFRPSTHNKISEWDYLYNKAHNEYLNTLANTGILGLTAYLIFIGFATFQLRKNPALLAGFISILITNFFGFSVVPVSLLFFLFPAFESLRKDELIENKELDVNQKLLIGGALLICGFMIFLIGRYWWADKIYNLGRLENQAGLYKSSIKDLQSAIDLVPNEAIYRNEMAKTLTNATISAAANLSSYAVAESDFAFSLSPRNMNIRQSRMSMYLQFGQISPIYLKLDEEFIKDSIPLSPTDPKLFLILGKVYANMGRIKDAITAFQKALILKPDYGDAKQDLEIVQKLQGK